MSPPDTSWLEDELRAVLAERADTAPRTADPWSRTQRAVRRDRRRRRTTALVAAACLGLGGVTVTGLLQDSTPDRRGSVADVPAVGVEQRLDEWPARGSLAGDELFLRQVKERVAATGSSVGHVLHAGDVGDRRVVLLLEPGEDGRGLVTSWTAPARSPAARLLLGTTGEVDLDVPVVAWMQASEQGRSPWLVLTPGGPSGSGGALQAGGAPVDVTVEPGPLFTTTGGVRREFWQERAWSWGVLAGAADGAETRGLHEVVTVSLGGGRELYRGPFHLVEDQPAPAGVMPQADEAAAAAYGDYPTDVTRLVRMSEALAGRFGHTASRLQVTAVWTGRLPGRDAVAMAVRARLPDGRLVEGVREYYGRYPSSDVREVLPGREVARPDEGFAVVWRDAEDPSLLRLVAPGAAAAVYHGQRSEEVALSPSGLGSLAHAQPSAIDNPPYEVVELLSADGATVAERDVPPPPAEPPVPLSEREGA